MDTALAPNARCELLVAMSTTILLRGKTLCRKLPGDRACVHAIETHLEDAAHQGSFFLIKLVLPLFVPRNVAIPQGDGSPLRMARFGASKMTALEPFEDFGTLIFRNGATHLEEEPPFWTFFEGM